MVAIANLRCEHLEDPLGIETLAPRLSWRLETERRAARQTAYRVNVATDRSNLSAMVKTDVFQTDTYILKGDGIETRSCRICHPCGTLPV